MKRQQDCRSRTAVGVEGLERRLLMDGDVRATFRGGDLSLRGDAADNHVVVTQPELKMVRVSGLDETTVNGEAFVEFPYAVDDVRIHARQGGADRLAIQGPITLFGDLVGRLGDGELVVEGSAGAVKVRGKVNVRAGEAGGVKFRNGVIVEGDVNVTAGGVTTVAAGRGTLPDVASASFSDPLDIDNPYFPLVPGTTYTYEEQSVDDETGETVLERIVVEVTDETRLVNGVVNRALRDRVYVDGLLVEDTSDWHAQDDDGNVWYFGEESTDFEYDEAGTLIGTSTATSWEAGVDGAKPGIIMLAEQGVGDAYYQEFEPGVALDQGEVLAVDDAATVPVGTFDNVLRTKDVSVLSPGGLEHKFYAPGLGLIRELTFDIQTGEVDGTLRLVSVELNGEPVAQIVTPDGFSGANPRSGPGTGRAEFRGETSIRAGGPVVLSKSNFADESDVESQAEVTIIDSKLAAQ